MVITWLPLLTQRWKDTGRDQTRNILHIEPIKYFLMVKFANLRWTPLNWILLEYKISKFNLFHLNIKFITTWNTRNCSFLDWLGFWLLLVKFHGIMAWVWKKFGNGSLHACKRFLLEQVPVFIIIFLDSEEEY